VTALRRWWRVLRLLWGGEPVIFAGPQMPTDAVCARCGAPASESWWPSVCALADEAKDWIPLCAEHDVELNEMTVRFLYGDKRNAALDEYRRAQLTVPPTPQETGHD
jgi:hypothetical protein